MRFLIATLLLAVPMFAEGPEFEVASIKPSVGGIPMASGGPGTNDPTHMNFPGRTLKTIIQLAFDVRSFQVVGADSLGAEFDFALSLPAGATKDDVKVMWRNLLISRFGLKFHMEKREFDVDELVIVPKGHKLTENNEAEPDTPNAGGVRKIDKDGRPILERPDMTMVISPGPNGLTTKIVARAQPMSALASNLVSQVGRPVIDKTGLTSKYDFVLEFSPATTRMAPAVAGSPGVATAAEAMERGLDLPAAMQQQLGLRLVKGKGMLDVVVVDKIERTPTEN